MMRFVLAAAALGLAAASGATKPVVTLTKIEGGTPSNLTIEGTPKAVADVLDSSVPGFALRLDITDTDDGFDVEKQFSAIGSIKGTQYDYGYTVGAAVVARTTVATTANAISKHSYTITFSAAAMGEYTIKLDKCDTWKKANDTSVAQAECDIEEFTIHLGFEPVVSVSQPDLAPTVNGLINAAKFDTYISVGAGGANTVTVADADDAALLTKPTDSVADISDGTRDTALTSKYEVVYKKAKSDDNDKSGLVQLAVAGGKITRGDGVKNYAKTVTLTNVGYGVALKLTEATDDTTPAALTVDLATNKTDAAAIWFPPTSQVELELKLASGVLTNLTTAAVAYADLFVTAPGDALAAFKLKSGTAASVAASSGAYNYTLDLDASKALPGTYTVAVKPSALTWWTTSGGTTVDTAKKSAGSSLNINIGLPTRLTFVDGAFGSLMDPAVTTGVPATVPIAVGASMAESATVFAVLSVTIPAELPNATAQAVDLAAWFDSKVEDADVALTKFLATATGVVEPTTKKRFSRVVNTTVSFYYQIDPTGTGFGAAPTTPISVTGGAFCTQSTELPVVCTAFVRDAVKVVRGDAMPKAVGVLHPDGDTYSVVGADKNASAEVWGGPFVGWATAMTSSVATVTREFTTTVGSFAASDVIVRGPVVNGTMATIPTSKIAFSAKKFNLAYAVAEFKDVAPGLYVFEVPAGEWNGYTPGGSRLLSTGEDSSSEYSTESGARSLSAAVYSNAKSIFTINVGYDVRFLPGIGPSSGGDDLLLTAFLPRRDINGPFILRSTDVRMRVHGAEKAGTAKPVLYDASRIDDKGTASDKTDDVANPGGVLKGLYRVSDTEWEENLAPGLTYANSDEFVTVDATNKWIDFRMGLGGLEDGEYVLVIDYSEATLTGVNDRKDGKWQNQQIRFILDRTSPAGAPASYTGRLPGNIPAPLFANVPLSRAGGIPLPSTLFSDAGSPDGKLTVSVTNPEDLRGLTIDGAGLASGRLTSPVAVLPPTGNAVLKVKAVDEAGNEGETTLTLQVRPQPGAVLTLSDRRGVQTRTQLFTGSAASFTGTGAARAMPLRAVVDFDEAVSGVTRTSLLCVLESGAACPLAGTGVTLTAAPGGRRYTFEFSVLASAVSADSTITVYVPSVGVTTVAGGFSVRNSNAATAVVDTAAPAGGRAFIAVVEGATVTVPVPADLCVDDYSSSTNIRATISAPPSGNGLSFTAGPLGSAVFSGRVTARTTTPTEFTVTCMDQAGNTATGVVAILAVAKPAQYTGTAGPVGSFTLDSTNTALDFTEDQAASDAVVSKKVFPSATFTMGADLGANESFTKIVVSLEGVQDPTFTLEKKHEGVYLATAVAPTGIAGTTFEKYAGSDPAAPSAGSISAWNALTGRSELVISAPLAGFSPANVQTILQNLEYYNDRQKVASGNRVVRVAVFFKPVVTGTDSTVAYIATGSRVVKVTGVNDVPVVTAFNKTNLQWVQGTGTTYSGAPVEVATTATITDADDDEYSSATVSVWNKQQDGTDDYDPCDGDRDVLALPLNYGGANKAPAVQGSWSAATCALTLQPVAPATRMTKAELEAALKAVTYVNTDVRNPLGWKTKVSSGDAAPNDATNPTVYGTRAIVLTVTDSANSGVLARTASNTVPKTGSSLVAADDKQIKLTFDLITVPPKVDYASLFGPAGVFTSSDTFAASKSFVVDKVEYTQLKFPLVIPAKSTGKKLYTLTFNLSQAVGPDGKYVDGAHAGGAIVDFDTKFPAAAEVKVFACVNDACTGGDKVEVTAAGVDGAVNTVFYGTTKADASPAVTPETFTRVMNDALDADATDTQSASFKATRFDYRRFDVSTLSLLIDTPDFKDGSKLGEYKFLLDFNGAVVPFYIDVLWEGCLDSTAASESVSDATKYQFKIKVNDVDTVIETYVIDALAHPASRENWYGLSEFAIADKVASNFYSTPSLCRYKPVTFPPSVEQTEDFPIGSTTFTATRDAIAAAAESLANASPEARIAALADLRRSAAGSFQIALPPNSLDGAASVDITFGVAPSTTVTALTASLPPLDNVQLDVALKLGPAGTQFSKPVKVCVFSGDTTPGSFKTLSVASQIDPADESKGYLPFEPLADQSFDEATGEVCGFTTHFSVFAPIVAPVPTNPTVPKLHLMGGSCPNQCSGKGACRQDGKCVCFPGFGGFDCSMRACPSAESWGEDQLVMHSQSECSGRGVCERSSGTCSCFDGYEGAACERSACPNSCSGHGKCRLLAELPEVQKAGYSDWEVRRLQVCQCDGGYSGPDCSLRTCPFGDDPETNCYGSATQGVAAVQRQVQKLTISFLRPTGSTANPEQDEFALVYRTAQGRNYTTPRIEDVFDATLDKNANNIAAALKSLPEFSVMDVTVTGDAGNSAANAVSQSFLITFTGDSTTGNVPLLQCPYNSAGTFGCAAPGCQPKFSQLRLIETTFGAQSGVSIDPTTILESPPPVSDSANNAETAGQWTVETVLTLREYSASAFPAPFYTYEFSDTKVYGEDGSGAGETKPTTVEETVAPPAGSNTKVQGPYGLVIDMTNLAGYLSSETLVSDVRTKAVTIKWRLPTCEVTQETAAETAFEAAECSNRGLCNRGTGTCECFSGYAGHNCAQQTVYI